MEAMREAQASLAIHCIRLHILIKISEPHIRVTERLIRIAVGDVPACDVDIGDPTEVFFSEYQQHHDRDHTMHRIATAANLELHPLANADIMTLSLADPLLHWARDRMVAGTSEPRIPVTDRLACIAMGLAPLAEVDFDNPAEAFFHTFYRHRLFWNGRPPYMAEIQSAIDYDWDSSMETIALEVRLERPV
ncbi:hypothetical protein CEP54_016106 [Fusarium duplospermum]|uniref:Uncharacterized protein n=1 Tax=Fusarium duplospermum TaxID=1325734 RepID=A0A428NI52_9HYPO|nr:hypothetical protein CEP54_016106 [Fusarium duplospermum]